MCHRAVLRKHPEGRFGSTNTEHMFVDRHAACDGLRVLGGRFELSRDAATVGDTVSAFHIVRGDDLFFALVEISDGIEEGAKLYKCRNVTWVSPRIAKLPQQRDPVPLADRRRLPGREAQPRVADAGGSTADTSGRSTTVFLALRTVRESPSTTRILRLRAGTPSWKGCRGTLQPRHLVRVQPHRRKGRRDRASQQLGARLQVARNRPSRGGRRSDRRQPRLGIRAFAVRGRIRRRRSWASW